MKYLIVVDMQNDFIDGALGTPEAGAIVDNVIEKINSFNGEVMWTMDTHGKNYLDTQEGKNLPVIHCVDGSDGWQVATKIGDALYRKTNGRSACYCKPTFGSISLGKDMELLAESGTEIEEIVLIGVCTGICVISNALLLKAFLPEVKITVDASCCACVTPESHKNALAAMKVCQINIENWEE